MDARVFEADDLGVEEDFWGAESFLADLESISMCDLCKKEADIP